MKRISLLCLSLLFCPFFIESMESNETQTYLEAVTQKNGFPPLNKPNRNTKKLQKNNDNKDVSSVSSSDSKLALNKQDEDLTNFLEKDLNQDLFNNVQGNPTKLLEIKQNNNSDLKIDEYKPEKTIIDNHQTTFAHSMTPVIQKEYSISQKLYNNSCHTPRSLALSWFKSDVSPEWRDRFIRDVSKAITAENETIVSNRDENKGEDAVSLIRKLKNKKMVRHDLILKMLNYFKKSEDNVHHLESLIKTEDKGYPLGSADCLKDTFKVLQGEKMRDFLLLAICMEEIQKRVQNYQKISNEIYNKTKDNKDVIGNLSTDDYGNPHTLFEQSQKLMAAITQQLEENK